LLPDNIGLAKPKYPDFPILENLMFDRLMENSMALWMLISGLFPVFLFGMIIKAYLHYRRTRLLLDKMPKVPVVTHAWVKSEDWVPSP
jgi:hypothetical protein